MTLRLHFVVEGQTEEEFVKSVLAPHLGLLGISSDARRVATGRARARIFRGGTTSYARVKRDLSLWMKEDKGNDAHFTTMVDLYAIPDDFPRYAELKGGQDPYARVHSLEVAMAEDIGHPRFVPYIQLHEFEALLLCDPAVLAEEFLRRDRQIANLVRMVSGFESPELIDDGHDTCPSRRIIAEIPEYEGRKPSAGPRIAGRIGLLVIRQKCHHFDDWLKEIETIKEREAS